MPPRRPSTPPRPSSAAAGGGGRSRLAHAYRRYRSRSQIREERRLRVSLAVDPQAPVLLLSPHWDDAVLDCWALLAGDAPLQVVNVFAGVPASGRLGAWDAITGARDSAARAGERIAEDRAALALAGREPVNLPFLDAQYRPPPPAPTLAELDAAVAGAVAAASRALVPAGLGNHPDHLLVRRYGRALLAAGIPVTLYAELPYGVRHGWPPWVDGSEPVANRDVDAFWLSFLAGVPELPPLRSARIEALDPDAAAAKAAALRCYATQLPCLDYAAAGLLERPEVIGYEVSWELRGADGT
jgi:LmbE family N-acetylglucosaminyl deacetylase